MCNVAALTFYATIYEDICCTCNNKPREKHVLGTASSGVYLTSKPPRWVLFDFPGFNVWGPKSTEHLYKLDILFDFGHFVSFLCVQ